MTMAKYGKVQGHHCWWLTVDGKEVANFSDEKQVDDIVKLELEKVTAEKWADNALEALDAVKASGIINQDDVMEMVELGSSGKPQKTTTRLS
ncbi:MULTISPECIES: hypothetical protein [unclassified Pseudoalteromonas]|uniref:hypothetical protein n=2 Tax=Pseudoalteromonas TaxID=53246 RepID=UPI000466F80D|nr:hypothetical protein FQP81_20305 [Pseudoalteromonas elyakovii]